MTGSQKLTGQVAKELGISRTYAKILATEGRVTGIEKAESSGWWLWSKEAIEQVRGMIKHQRTELANPRGAKNRGSDREGSS